MSSRGLITDWYDVSTVSKMLDRFICEGDILEFQDKGETYHSGVYIGHHLNHGDKNPMVAHFSAENCCNGNLPKNSVMESIFGEDEGKDGWSILEDSLYDLFNQYPKVRISNGFDLDFEPYFSSEIVKKAREKRSGGVGEEDEWVMPSAFRSCKHFALFCRYDENLINSLSEETQKSVDNLKLAACGVVGVAAAGLASYLVYKSCSDSKKKKKDN